jgi:hypothetical protein
VEGDKKAMKEIVRVCKRLHRMFITVPYGKLAINSMQRVYDEQALKRLAEHLSAEFQVEYFTKNDLVWSKSVKVIAEQVNSLSEVRSVACISLIKVPENVSSHIQRMKSF